MKKMMLVGETRSGKSSIIQALSDELFTPRRAMAIQYCGQFINTPGEFLENSRFYHALITSSADCHVLAMIQDATRNYSLFPPLFASMFNRKVIGIVTKSEAPSANTARAELFLKSAGVKEIFHLDISAKEGIDSLKRMLK
ncbi:EutP/PduV family microcompartment system protein [Maridesulfovibrio zosterae]|uniref:EutP/PduV family microcompartment system protein n=1 Tax=Maridesulfovibrio zosterae TaxID=82171 RepID=UPI0003F90AEB|nr:EutP/PduV family microcompartment system protein [Maridesulfovibrio zosterae]